MTACIAVNVYYFLVVVSFPNRRFLEEIAKSDRRIWVQNKWGELLVVGNQESTGETYDQGNTGDDSGTESEVLDYVYMCIQST